MESINTQNDEENVANNNDSQKRNIWGKVVCIQKTYILVKFENHLGICHISEISDYLIKNIWNIFKLNESYNFQIIGNQNDKFVLSFKRVHAKMLKKRRKIIPTYHGFENVKKDLHRRLNIE